MAFRSRCGPPNRIGVFTIAGGGQLEGSGRRRRDPKIPQVKRVRVFLAVDAVTTARQSRRFSHEAAGLAGTLTPRRRSYPKSAIARDYSVGLSDGTATPANPRTAALSMSRESK